MQDKVNAYYRDNFLGLTPVKQFHFASRLWLWYQDEEMADILRGMRTDFCGNGDSSKMEAILNTVVKTPLQEFGSKNAVNERAPYFDKYPLLRPCLLALFRLNFTETVYGIEARQHLLKHFSAKDLDELQNLLISDNAAIMTLSTHAVNFLYLYNRFYKRDDSNIPVDFLYDLIDSYDLSNPTQLLLAIYLLTHCIIGETMFYKRHIPSRNLPIYEKMLISLEDILERQYNNINLDNKFEILVCSRLLGKESHLANKIYEEANHSMSQTGDFLVDTVNNTPQSNSRDFDSSEHRNVLFLLSLQTFKPTDEIIT